MPVIVCLLQLSLLIMMQTPEGCVQYYKRKREDAWQYIEHSNLYNNMKQYIHKKIK